MTIVNLVLLSIQGWSGDTVNLFATFPSGSVSSFQVFQALARAGPGPLAVWHGVEGVLVLLLAIGIVVSVFMRTRSRNLRIVSLLALFFVVSAVYAGLQFVFSGFTDNGASAQMGGSFIGAYAMTFLVLYYSMNEGRGR